MIQVKICLTETSGRPGYHLIEQNQGSKTRMGGIAGSCSFFFFFTHLEMSAQFGVEFGNAAACFIFVLYN